MSQLAGLFQKKYEPPYELKLSAIPLEVFNHPELEKVDVWNHPLEALPAQIGRLTNLHTLRLNTGRISSIPNELFNLINLTDLNLGYNQLKGISASIQRLSRLEVLWLHENPLKELPSAIQNLGKLRELGISSCQLSQIPEWIGKLTNLERLDANNNSIKELPYSMSNLLKLKVDLFLTFKIDCQDLYLSNNKITTLPAGIHVLAALEWLYLDGNPMVSPPSSVIKRGIKAIQEFLRDFSQGSENWKQIKIIAMGDENTGKTTTVETLQKLLANAQTPEPPKTPAITPTVGIDMKSMKIGDGVKLSIWDFGGQSQYSVSHQLFLGSANTIYLLFVNAQKSIPEIRDSMTFWIRFVTSSAAKEKLSKEYSIIAIGNQIDAVPQSHIKELEKFFSEIKLQRMISNYCLISAKQGSVSDLQKAFEEQMKALLQDKNSFFTVPRIYKVISDKLKSLHRAEKKLIVHTSAIPDTLIRKEQSNDTCFSFLQDMGVILFNRSNQMICLDPQLMAKALACFLMPPQHELLVYGRVSDELKGMSILTRKVMENRLISANVATNENVSDVIQCLQQFDFCFQLEAKEAKELYNRQDGYLFPSLRPRVAKFNLEVAGKSSRMKTMGVAITEVDGNPIGVNFFLRFQIIARKYHAWTPMYGNGMALAYNENSAKVWLGPQMEIIQIVIQGNSPANLWNLIKKMLEETRYSFPGLNLSYSFICPQCITDMISGTTSPSLGELPPDILACRFSEREVGDESGTFTCDQRHRSEKSWLVNGFSPRLHVPELFIHANKQEASGIRELVSKLENLQSTGMMHLREMTISISNDLQIPIRLADYWFSLGEQFPEIKDAFSFIQKSIRPAGEKVDMIVQELKILSNPITLERFTQTIRRIISQAIMSLPIPDVMADTNSASAPPSSASEEELSSSSGFPAEEVKEKISAKKIELREDKKQEKIPEKIPEKTQDKIPEKVVSKLPRFEVPEKKIEKVPSKSAVEKIPSRIPAPGESKIPAKSAVDKIPTKNASDKTVEKVVEKVQEKPVEKAPEKIPVKTSTEKPAISKLTEKQKVNFMKQPAKEVPAVPPTPEVVAPRMKSPDNSSTQDSKEATLTKNPEVWTIDQVCSWLKKLGDPFAQLINIFRQHQIDGTSLVHLSFEEWKEIIKPLGLRQRLTLEIGKLTPKKRETEDHDRGHHSKRVEDVDPSYWSVEDVITWMSGLKLVSDYREMIKMGNVNGEVLQTMKTKEDWKELGVSVFGDLRILGKATSSLFE